MAKVEKIPKLPKGARHSRPAREELLALAAERVELPDVPMVLDYQDDVDTLCIRFQGPVSSTLIEDDEENGVIGIYQGRKLVGIEILDITGQLEFADPR